MSLFLPGSRYMWRKKFNLYKCWPSNYFNMLLYSYNSCMKASAHSYKLFNNVLYSSDEIMFCPNYRVTHLAALSPIDGDTILPSSFDCMGTWLNQVVLGTAALFECNSIRPRYRQWIGLAYPNQWVYNSLNRPAHSLRIGSLI